MKTNEIATVNPSELKFKSAVLNEQTATIIQNAITASKADSTARVNIAKAIYEICHNVDLSAEGFENHEDYGKRCFGWAKAQTYNYKAVGCGLAVGKLRETDNNGNPLSFSILVDMTRLEKEVAQKLITDGEITADMTRADAAEVIDANKEKRQTKPRKEKEVSIFCMENDDAPTAVTTPSHWKEVKGEPFHEWKQDGRVYMLYISGGSATVYWYSTGKVVDAESAEVVK